MRREGNSGSVLKEFDPELCKDASKPRSVCVTFGPISKAGTEAGFFTMGLSTEERDWGRVSTSPDCPFMLQRTPTDEK